MLPPPAGLRGLFHTGRSPHRQPKPTWTPGLLRSWNGSPNNPLTRDCPESSSSEVTEGGIPAAIPGPQQAAEREGYLDHRDGVVKAPPLAPGEPPVRRGAAPLLLPEEPLSIKVPRTDRAPPCPAPGRPRLPVAERAGVRRVPCRTVRGITGPLCDGLQVALYCGPTPFPTGSRRVGTSGSWRCADFF